MPGVTLTNWLVTSLLLGLRVAPVFALAPPFTLTRVPALFRVLLGLGLSACLAGIVPQTTGPISVQVGDLLVTGLRELLLGSIFVLAFHLAFGGLYLAGRLVDVQAGYGLAMLIDPTTRGQTPLVGTLFAYTGAAAFFGMDGHLELLRILAASFDAIPLGAGEIPDSLAPLARFMSLVFLTGMGVAGGAVLALFVADLAIAMMSRSLPQMNVLVLGLQLKALLLLAVLPLVMGAAGAQLARLMANTLEAAPRLL